MAGSGNRVRLLKPLDFVAPCEKACCARARQCVRRCEIVAGARNPLICGCKLGADVSQNAWQADEAGAVHSAVNAGVSLLHAPEQLEANFNLFK